MSPKEVIRDTIARIDRYRKKEPGNKYTYTSWIIKRYIHYMIEAILHGYIIKIYSPVPIAKIYLGYTPVEKLRKSHKKRYVFSSRMFGFMFYISITGKRINDETYYFLMDQSLRKRIADIINTDTIYQFVKT
jgi:hypothetical protein